MVCSNRFPQYWEPVCPAKMQWTQTEGTVRRRRRCAWLPQRIKMAAPTYQICLCREAPTISDNNLFDHMSTPNTPSVARKVPSDIEIAQSAKLLPIDRVASEAGILPEELELYG